MAKTYEEVAGDVKMLLSGINKESPLKEDSARLLQAINQVLRDYMATDTESANLRKERDEARAQAAAEFKKYTEEVGRNSWLERDLKEAKEQITQMLSSGYKGQILGKDRLWHSVEDLQDIGALKVLSEGQSITIDRITKRLNAAEYICRWIETQGIRIYSETELEAALKAWQKERDETQIGI